MNFRTHTIFRLARWSGLLVIGLLLAACMATAEEPDPTREPAPTFTPTPEVEPTPVDPAAAAAAATEAAQQAEAEQPADPEPEQDQPPAEEEPAEEEPAEPEPEPTATPTPAPAEVVINTTMNIRGGPGTNYNIIGSANQGQRFPVTGRNNDGTWWQIDFNGQPAWVFADLVTAQNTESIAVASNIPEPPPPTNTPVPPPPTQPPPQPEPEEPAPEEPAPEEPAPAPGNDNFPFLLLEGVESCAPNAGTTYFNGFVRRSDNSPMNGVCVHINYYEPRNTKCSGCDGVGDGNWSFSPFGGPAPPGTPVEIFVVPCPSEPMPEGGQTQGTGFGDLTPQSPKWTRTINESEQCTGITFVQK